jgi:hypothetical protein
MNDEDENASELQFGDEFSNVTCLTNDEMYFLLVKRQEARVAINEYEFLRSNKIFLNTICADHSNKLSRMLKKLPQQRFNRMWKHLQWNLMSMFNSINLNIVLSIVLLMNDRKLRNLQLERSVDRKKVPLHPFEVASLANLVNV